MSADTESSIEETLDHAEMAKLLENKRMKLQNMEVMKWLRKTCKKKAKKKYLLYPQELLKSVEINRTFKTIDKDNSSIPSSLTFRIS